MMLENRFGYTVFLIREKPNWKPTMNCTYTITISICAMCIHAKSDILIFTYNVTRVKHFTFE